jgi:hypothetical protein
MSRAQRSTARTVGAVLTAAVLALAGISLVAAPAAAIVIIPPGDLSPFGAPCTLDVHEIGQSRVLSWAAVAGAATYRVGFVGNGEVVGLAEITGTTFEHIGWAASECLEYVVVAYDAGGVRVCAAHVPRIGKCH